MNGVGASPIFRLYQTMKSNDALYAIKATAVFSINGVLDKVLCGNMRTSKAITNPCLIAEHYVFNCINRKSRNIFQSKYVYSHR